MGRVAGSINVSPPHRIGQSVGTSSCVLLGNQACQGYVSDIDLHFITFKKLILHSVDELVKTAAQALTAANNLKVVRAKL